MHYAQSGRGVALADPAFGQVYWSSSLYVGKALSAGRPRPYRYARTSFAMDGKGRALIDIRKIPEVRVLLPGLYGAPAMTPLPFVGATDVADQLPLQVAAVTDVAAFAIVENSANQLAEGIATAAMGGGAGQAFGANVDYALNNFVIPITSVAGGAATTATAVQSLDAANTEIASIKAASVALSSRAATVLADIRAATTARANLIVQIANQAMDTTKSADFVKNTAGLRSSLSALDAKISALQSEARTISSINNATNAKLAQWIAKLPELEKIVADGSVLAKFPSSSQIIAAKLGSFVNGIKGLSKGFTYLAYAANTAGIIKNAYLIYNFDANAGGDLQLNGTYGLNFNSLLENAANLASIAGDAASGNPAAVALDVGNFAVGRVSDIVMSYLAMDAAQQQAHYAEIQYLLKNSKRLDQQVDHSYQQMKAAADAINADADRIGKEISALKAQLGTRTSVSAPDWQDPRIDPDTGLPKAAYWAWLKANDPDKLRAMGIDPNAPVGGWPPQTQQTRQSDTDMPRQPDGNPGYPTRDPRTVRKKPTPATQTAQADATPVADDVPPPNPTPAPAPPHPHPAPVSAQADAAARAWALQATNFVLDKFDLGSVSFADDWSPVTFDPVTWTPPVWTPVTWTPPKWVPVTFDAPKPSDLPWTTINDGAQFPATAGNMAYSFASIDGRVATDLTPYAGWLKTQNQQYVEQLAASAGYPNLASALADSANLMGHAGAPGFQQYAWGAPVADPFVSADIDQSQRLMARAQYTLGGLLLKSGMFTDATRPAWTGPQQSDGLSPALCGR